MSRNKKPDCLDYSKWDHIVVDDEDEADDELQPPPSQQPRVTRLQQPSTIVTTADGGIRIVGVTTSAGVAEGRGSKKKKKEQQQQPILQEQKTCTASLDDENEVESCCSSPSSSRGSAVGKPKNQNDNTCNSSSCIPDSWTDKGACVVLPNNNNTGTYYYWNQDRYTVQIRIPIPPDDDDSSTRKAAKYNVSVTNMIKYVDRNNAILATDGQQHRQQTLEIRDVTHDTIVLFEEHLAYPVHSAQDDDDDDDIDWCVERSSDHDNTLPDFIICVTLYKATPMSNMTFWWNRCFKSDSQDIDLTWRRSSDTSAWTQAWDEAHKQFLRKHNSKKNRQPT